MTSKTGIKIVLGAGSAGDSKDPSARFNDVHQAQDLLNLFRRYGGDETDSARIYSPDAPETCEELMGQTDVTSWARIGSKVWSLPGQHVKERLDDSVAGQLKAYNLNRLYIEYLHAPDPDTPIPEVAANVDALHEAGNFERFGVSNYSVAQMEELLAVCEEKGYVRPSVYQGQYNAVVRSAEEALLPLLRKHNISFYAWSPAAGGVFSKSSYRLKGSGFTADMWKSWYNKPQIIQSIAEVNERASALGTTAHAIILRWIVHHSQLSAEYGDAIVIGASSLDQLESTMKSCQGDPLPPDLVDLNEKIGLQVKDVAPHFTIYN